MNLWKIFGIDKKAEGDHRELGKLFDAIEELLGDRAEDEVKYVTGFAGLIGKVAYADMEISEDELQRMKKVLIDALHLKESHVNAIVEMLHQHSVQLFSIEDYRYVRMINQVCDKGQKTELIKAMFAVASADGSVSAEEDSAIFVVAKGIGISHKEFVTVRAQFRDFLDVLKG